MTAAIRVGFVSFCLALVAAVAYGQARTPYTRPSSITTPGSIQTSAAGDQFVCTSTTATCEVESSIDAATMTSTVPAFDIGPTATPGTNDKLACFSYGPTGSKTRTACVDAEGDINARVFQSTALAAGTGFACTNVGCRLSLGNTGRYLVDDGTNLEFIAPVQATTFEATTASGSSLTGGGASGPLLITSNTPDSHTSTTVGAITLQASQDIDPNDQLFLLKDNTGTNIFRVAENGSVYTVNQITSASQIVSDLGSFAGGNASTTLGFNSNTTDAQTSGTVPAIRLRATQNITDTDLLLSLEDSANNRRVTVNELGSLTAAGNITAGSGLIGGFLNVGLYYLRASGSITIADSGGAGAAAYTWQPSFGQSVTLFTCNDADGCDITMNETTIASGVINKAVNVSANNITFTDTAGLNEMAGNFTMGQWDTIEFMYVTDRFVETSRSNN